MFLHSGASLHGHEYSNRHSLPATNVAQRRNTLLRSAFATPMNRASTFQPDTRLPSNDSPKTPSSLPHTRRLSDSTPLRLVEPVVRFQEPDVTPPTVSKPEAMSEDEGSLVSDSDASRASSSVRRTRRKRTTVRKSTTYLLAHPPPKLRNKQRLIHLRPKLLLQVQQLSAGQRPRPAIDVYPSSAMNGSLIAPLLKRFPRIAPIKRELSIQDVMLVRSEDYGLNGSESDSDADEDNFRSRDLLAILSPLRMEDKAEIVLTDGTVWVATPSHNASGDISYYEFTSVDFSGNTITARWVRKANSVKSTPGTPISEMPPSNVSQPPGHKFIFSIIDPNCRRHPILATLTNTSLDILDSYTTVSPSASRYPPTSSLLSSPVSSKGDESPGQGGRTTQQVEDWQKSFISISAIWVALRHGWAPNCRPTDIGSPAGSVPNSPSIGNRSSRSQSLNCRPETIPKVTTPDLSGRQRCPTAMRTPDQTPPSWLPRRATSTGAAFMHKRRTMQGSDQTGEVDVEKRMKLNRRAFSGDWNPRSQNRSPEQSLAAVVDSSVPQPIEFDHSKRTSTLAPPPLPTGRSAFSMSYPGDAMSPELHSSARQSDHDTRHGDFLLHTTAASDSDDMDRKVKRQKWRNLTNWFRRLQGR
ncbi:hypothetical protein F4778DRAFT_527772 [Xylariomycetidae sp. FL2044]|nr:hypothetical protein F4778DRAFT_527772 [Xylariomycetidae sp. FL2044]